LKFYDIIIHNLIIRYVSKNGNEMRAKARLRTINN